MKYLVESKKSKQNKQEQKALISTLVWLLTTIRFIFEREKYTTSWFNLYIPDHYIPDLLRFLSYSVTCEARTSLLVGYFALLIKKTRNIQDLSIFSRVRYYSFRRDMCNSSVTFFHVNVCL